MENINKYTLTLSLEEIGEALQGGWESALSASRNLGKALQKCIKSTLGPEYLEKVDLLLSDDDAEDFIDPNINGYVTSRRETMAYLAACNPSGVVLVNTQLSGCTKKKPSLVIRSLCRLAPDGDYPCWEEMMGKIWEIYKPLAPVCYGYNEIKQIKHLKVKAIAHFNPGEYEFKRDIPNWHDFSFPKAILRLCNLQDLPFKVTQRPSTVFVWIPLIASGHNGPNMLKREIFRMKEAEEVEMEGSPELLALNAFVGLSPRCFVRKDGAYQTVVPIYHNGTKIGSIELNFVDIDKECEDAKDF